MISPDLFVDNPLCRLLGIEWPVVQGGMVWAAGWPLASAVSNAGGLGLIGAGSMTPEVLSRHIDKARMATRRPFGVNIPLTHPNSAQNVAVCLEQGVRVVVTAAGSARRYTEQLKAAGVVVGHVVPSGAMAKKVEQAGCDFVVAEGVEAGGHNGRAGLSSLVLWPQVADQVSIPLVAAGGIGDGRQMVAAFALGASGVQLGTRFAVTKESTAHPGYKAACVAAPPEGTLLYNTRHSPIRSLINAYVTEFAALEFGGADLEVLGAFRGRGRSKRGIFEGDQAQGELVAGQIAGVIKDIPTVAEVMNRLIEQFVAARSF